MQERLISPTKAATTSSWTLKPKSHSIQKVLCPIVQQLCSVLTTTWSPTGLVSEQSPCKLDGWERWAGYMDDVVTVTQLSARLKTDRISHQSCSFRIYTFKTNEWRQLKCTFGRLNWSLYVALISCRCTSQSSLVMFRLENSPDFLVKPFLCLTSCQLHALCVNCHDLAAASHQNRLDMYLYRSRANSHFWCDFSRWLEWPRCCWSTAVHILFNKSASKKLCNLLSPPQINIVNALMFLVLLQQWIWCKTVMPLF